MIKSCAAPAIALTALASLSMAEPLIVVDEHRSAPWVVAIDTETLAVTSEASNLVHCQDAFSSGGVLSCGDTGGITRRTLDGSLIELLAFDDAFDIDLTASGRIMTLDRAYGHTLASGLYERDSTGLVTWSATIPGFDIMGMTVPRAGPFEDGILVLAFDQSTYRHYFFRWRRDVGGALIGDGPFGPLDLIDDLTASTMPGGGAIHPTAAADGQSFYVVEPCTGRIQEFDTAGYFLRTFATIAPDAAALASGVPGAPIDVPTNILSLDDGSVFVTTTRRLYRFDLAGNITGRCDRIFGVATALTLGRAMPFETAGITCAPWSVGFWKRQCASQGLRPAPRPSRRGGAVPPVHPLARGVNLPATIAQADAWLAPHGITTCAALQPDSPNTWREKALRRYAAVALNFESRRLGRRCVVTIDGVDTEAGPVLDELRALLGSSDEDDLKRAFHLTGRLLGEE